MVQKMLFFVFFMILLCCHAQDDTWTQFQNSNDYYMVHRPKEGLNYPDGLSYCDKLGAKMASIHSKAENDFVYQLARKGIFNGNNWEEMTLIGLNSSGSEGEWHWSDASEVNYTNWQKGEPNNHITGEECVVIFTSTEDHFTMSSQYHHVYRGEWNDLGCNRKFKSIVCKKQIKPTTEPTTTSPAITSQASRIEENVSTSANTINITKTALTTGSAVFNRANRLTTSYPIIRSAEITTTTSYLSEVENTTESLPMGQVKSTDATSETRTEVDVNHTESDHQVQEALHTFGVFYTVLGLAMFVVVVLVAGVLLLRKMKKHYSTFVLSKNSKLVTDDEIPLVGLTSRRQYDDEEGLRDTYSIQNEYVY